jgi:hypothetical protein
MTLSLSKSILSLMHNVFIKLSLKKILYISINPVEGIYNFVPRSRHKIPDSRLLGNISVDCMQKLYSDVLMAKKALP